ncbi:uncharacterized protein TRIREDRAFT_104911 [Trichoderma reesei QM6a]|uniref:Predicted protein n=2 Tax=Hypocrea jecorina TaxID=51453 RepID=G0RCX1_HYPJQ|nr:uncharacterized protein TRIREDRAFT_104911 [Trichoderma reesei QM6a]EGR50876.1 predicted protein [Trichoderma reesei QM6a]ETS05617.1 hypothetical protein M419DRAFT_71182 [Trichoderma reesei RUT C-30]
MARSSRATRPPPLELDDAALGILECSRDSLDSPIFSPSKRVGTSSTAATSPQSISSPQRRTSFGFIKSSPTVNVHTTCGRHTDQLLFGGPSLSGLARAFLWKKKQRRVSSD